MFLLALDVFLFYLYISSLNILTLSILSIKECATDVYRHICFCAYFFLISITRCIANCCILCCTGQNTPVTFNWETWIHLHLALLVWRQNVGYKWTFLVVIIIVAIPALYQFVVWISSDPDIFFIKSSCMFNAELKI